MIIRSRSITPSRWYHYRANRNPARRANRRFSLRAFATTLTTLLALGLTPPSANAEILTLCLSKDYTCTAPGYSDTNGDWSDKYYAAGHHNSTRYVAWRLAQTGMEDPGVKWGRAAYEWWENAPGVKDTKPEVGAIAYFNEDWTKRHWGNPYGHIGIVERVYSNGAVDVTSDFYQPPLSMRHVFSHEDLPTGYIHLRDTPDAAPAPLPSDANADGVAGPGGTQAGGMQTGDTQKGPGNSSGGGSTVAIAVISVVALAAAIIATFVGVLQRGAWTLPPLR